MCVVGWATVRLSVPARHMVVGCADVCQEQAHGYGQPGRRELTVQVG